MKQIHIKLPESLHRALKIQAAINEQTLQEYVIAAISEKLKLEQSLDHATDEWFMPVPATRTDENPNKFGNPESSTC